MAQIKAQDTTPEMVVRRLVHSMGFRYRLHKADLPGKPDLAFVSKRKLIFVHGCFWHGHSCKRGARQPKTNADYWRRKIAGNYQRDQITVEKLKRLGWDIHVVWECETKDLAFLRQKLEKFLG